MQNTDTLQSGTSIATLYGLFALISIAANIAAQALTTRLYPGPWEIAIAIGVGTAAGLIVKYALDKRYIFRFQAHNAAHDARTFLLYAVMGLATTAIFWGTETVFHVVFHTAPMRYVGAIIGLTVGYITKYRLDKRFVFVY